MGNFEYFKSIIKTWEDKEKHTPTMCRDMKEVIRQFDSVQDELLPDQLAYLKPVFNEIYKEVYK